MICQNTLSWKSTNENNCFLSLTETARFRLGVRLQSLESPELPSWSPGNQAASPNLGLSVFYSVLCARLSSSGGLKARSYVHKNQISVFVPENEAIILSSNRCHFPSTGAVVSKAVTPVEGSLNRAPLTLTIEPAARAGARGRRVPLCSSLLSRESQSEETALMTGALRSREQFDFNCQPVP